MDDSQCHIIWTDYYFGLYVALSLECKAKFKLRVRSVAMAVIAHVLNQFFCVFRYHSQNVKNCWF